MANTNIKLWVGATDGLLYKSYGSNTTADPLVFMQGDLANIELHLVQRTQANFGQLEEVPFPNDATVRLAIGKVEARAEAGNYTISYGADTATLPYNATSTQIQAALNALPSIAAAGGVTVAALSTSVTQVNFVSPGVNDPLVVDVLALAPTCAAKVITLRAGTTTLRGAYVIKVKQAPVVFQNTWTPTDAPVISVTQLTANTAKRVTIDPAPKTGSWSISGTGVIAPKVEADGDETNLATYWTELHSERLSVAATEADFLYGTTNSTPLLYQGQTKFQYSVTKVADYTWDFTLKDDYDVPVGYTMPLTVSGDGLVGFKGKQAVVTFDTAEVEYLMNGNTSAEAVLEIEMETPTSKQTLLQINCTILANLIDQPNFTPITYGSPVGEAPVDGLQYTRKDGAWTPLSLDGGTY